MKLDGLRTALPQIYAPMKACHAHYTNSERFQKMRNAAVQAMADIADLREEWTSDRSQKILSEAAESRRKDVDLRKARDVPLYGWNHLAVEDL